MAVLIICPPIQYSSDSMGGNRRVTIITPVKGRNRTSSITQRAIPVYFTSIENKGVRRAMEYASKVSLENTRLREKERVKGMKGNCGRRDFDMEIAE